MLSHAKAVQVYRDLNVSSGRIGITLNSCWSEPLQKDDPSDVEASYRALQFEMGWFANPIFGDGDYPKVMRERVGDRLPVFTPEEKVMLKGSITPLSL